MILILGNFISVDEQLFHAYDKWLVKVLVELDTSEGLLEVIHIAWGDRVLMQLLDYLHVSFICHFCYSTGHLR